MRSFRSPLYGIKNPFNKKGDPPAFSVSFTGLSTDSLGSYGQIGNHAAIGYTSTCVPIGDFDPATLFAASEQGAWYDPSDLSTLWQDTAGTVPVTADGQEVARMDDKSGNGHHVTQSTAGRLPLYKTSGGLHWLDFDGTDDCLFTAAAMNMSASDAVSIITGVTREADGTARILCELSTSTNSFAGTFFVTAPDSTTNRFASLARGNLTAVLGHQANIAGSPAAPDTAVLTITHDISDDLSTIERNNVAGTNGTADKGSGNFASDRAFYIGARGDASARFDGRLYGMIVRGGASTAQELTDAETWMAAKTGVTL